MSPSPVDARFMARALQLAKRGLYTTDPNPRVGCVITKNDNIVGEGWHQRAGEAHAEIHALRACGQQDLSAATVYLTLEPCSHHGRTPPCAEALIKARVGRVLVAMADPNPKVAGSGLEALCQAGIAVDVGLMQTEAEALNPGYISRMRRQRPLVRIKLAASLDGRTALANGASQWITRPSARADVQHWRARSSAILTGSGTVLKDDPLLTVRDIPTGQPSGRQPLRVVVDNNLSIPPSAKILSAAGNTLIATVSEDEAAATALRDAGAELMRFPGDGRIELLDLLQELARREINECHVEAGARLCGALLQAGLADEMVLYLAPHLLGDKARGMFDLPSLASLSQRLALKIQDVRAIGEDWRILCKLDGPKAQ